MMTASIPNMADAANAAASAGHSVPADSGPGFVSTGAQIADGFFGAIVDVTGLTLTGIVFFLLTRLFQTWLLHRSINKAIESGSAHAPVLIEKVNKPMEFTSDADRPGDDRNGLVLIAIGLAMVGFGFIQGDDETIRIAAGAALFPLFVGIALLIRRRLAGSKDAQEPTAG